MKKPTKVEAFVEEVDELTKEEVQRVAKALQGIPSEFERFEHKVLSHLQQIGVAIQLEENKWARGHKWSEYIRNL